MRNVIMTALAAPFFMLATACGGETPAARAIEGEATGDYEGISGGDTPPAMEAIGPIDTIPLEDRPIRDTVPIEPPPPPSPQQQQPRQPIPQR